jgi:CBS domain-containing protein
MTPLPRVADYMIRDLVTLSPLQEVNHAMAVLLDRRFSGAPVLDGAGHLVGVLSKKDCLRAALEASYYRDWGKPVSAYMTPDPETMDPALDIVAACERFVSSQYRRFPVVEGGRLLGQISRADILRAMAENWNGTARQG